ncbi:hypothetical protein Rhopal_004450-T1 [Rhodotorula paludigena]|uniref:Uncharacterized protein n=1 Tax=Rhodotorula paludigena TaxID=86838 RepID=A0AAV5GQ96_9BASI|nr:hypothetical protein Rhopal_004450-T1 [Rhodotorula paludigena]
MSLQHQARRIYLNLVKPKHVTFIITCALDPKPTLITVNGHHEMDKWTWIRTIIGKAGKERGLAVKLIEEQHIVHYHNRLSSLAFSCLVTRKAALRTRSVVQ